MSFLHLIHHSPPSPSRQGLTVPRAQLAISKPQLSSCPHPQSTGTALSCHHAGFHMRAGDSNSHWDLVSVVAVVKGRVFRRNSCLPEETWLFLTRIGHFLLSRSPLLPPHTLPCAPPCPVTVAMLRWNMRTLSGVTFWFCASQSSGKPLGTHLPRWKWANRLRGKRGARTGTELSDVDEWVEHALLSCLDLKWSPNSIC